MSSPIKIEVFVTDAFWPDLKIIVTNHTAGTVREDRAQYDSASVRFEPLLADAVRMSIQRLIKQRKGER